MELGATNELLDELIPPPGPRWRRIAGWAVFLSLVAVVTFSWQAGTILPRLDEAWWASWGGEGPVHAEVVVGNGSPRAIEITTGPRARPGLEARGYTLGTYDLDQQTGILHLEPGIDMSDSELDIGLDPDPFPLRLDPGESVVITVIYDVVDCAAIRAIDPRDTAMDLGVRMASGPLRRFEHKRHIPTVVSMGSWPAEISQYACGFPDPLE